MSPRLLQQSSELGSQRLHGDIYYLFQDIKARSEVNILFPITKMFSLYFVTISNSECCYIELS